MVTKAFIEGSTHWKIHNEGPEVVIDEGKEVVNFEASQEDQANNHVSCIHLVLLNPEVLRESS